MVDSTISHFALERTILNQNPEVESSKQTPSSGPSALDSAPSVVAGKPRRSPHDYFVKASVEHWHPMQVHRCKWARRALPYRKSQGLSRLRRRPRDIPNDGRLNLCPIE